MAPMHICKHVATSHNCTATANPCGELRCKGKQNSFHQMESFEFYSLTFVNKIGSSIFFDSLSKNGIKIHKE